MKLTRGKGNPAEGGCWMAVADYYSRGSLDWTDQPECVDPIVRRLCIRLNDMLDDGEREKVIGPHLWAPIGTNNLALLPERLKMVVRFALDCAADAGDDYKDAAYAAANAAKDAAKVAANTAVYWAAKVAANAAAKAADWDAKAVDWTDIPSSFVDAANWVVHYAADAAADDGSKILDLILRLCALSTPRELPEGAVSKEETLRVVCHWGVA